MIKIHISTNPSFPIALVFNSNLLDFAQCGTLVFSSMDFVRLPRTPRLINPCELEPPSSSSSPAPERSSSNERPFLASFAYPSPIYTCGVVLHVQEKVVCATAGGGICTGSDEPCDAMTGSVARSILTRAWRTPYYPRDLYVNVWALCGNGGRGRRFQDYELLENVLIFVEHFRRAKLNKMLQG